LNLSAETLMASGPDSRFVNDLVASPNIGARRGYASPQLLILHYTGLETVRRSIDVLCDPICEVSCHYLVDVDGRVTQMVREADRAWHAGLSYWRGETDINSSSVGIEIQNPGHALGYPDFPEAQMSAVVSLSRDIVVRNQMRATDVLAHSDIAPQRKIDPGEKFDWQRLYAAGVGHWVLPHAVDNDLEQPPIDMQKPGKRTRTCQKLLSQYGYDVAADGMLDAATLRVISAFQRHFRPARIDGMSDASTIATLRDLIAQQSSAALLT
jgi:N-acetylmuramoyl-L-alanine amidase